MGGSLPRRAAARRRRGRDATLAAVVLAQLDLPGPKALVEFLDEHLRAGDRLVQVFAECEVLYSGRAASVAEARELLGLKARASA